MVPLKEQQAVLTAKATPQPLFGFSYLLVVKVSILQPRMKEEEEEEHNSEAGSAAIFIFMNMPYGHLHSGVKACAMRSFFT